MTLRVLLIEDSENDAVLIVRELQRAGYQVVWERVDTAAALTAALAQTWDVITCDWVMPQFGAPAALVLLRRHQVDAPVIIVSGEVPEEVAVSAMRAGAHDCVSKDRLARLAPAIEREVREAEVRRARTRAEQALEGREPHFRSLIEQALDLVSILEPDGTIRYASPSHEQMLGFKPEELVGHNAFEWVHPDDQARVVRRFTKGLAQSPGLGSTEHRFRRKDGSWCFVEGVARNLIADPVVHGILVNTRDITRRKQAEERLRQQAEELRDLYDHAACGYHSLDRDGRFVRINETELRWLGYAREEVVGRKTLSDVVTPAGKELFQAGFARFVATGIVKDLEFEMVRKDGSTFPVLLNGTAVTDANGQFVMGRSTVVDLTERRCAEETQRAQALRLEMLRETDRAILEARSVDELAGAAMRRIRDLVPCDLALVWLFDLDAGVAHVVASEPPGAVRGLEATTVSLREFSAPATFVEHPELCVDDLTRVEQPKPVVRRLLGVGMRSVLSEALIGGERLLGVLNLSATRPAAFAAEHGDIAREVADQLAIALHQAHLRSQLQQHAAELEQRVRERTAQLEMANGELAAFSYSVSHDLRAPLRAIAGFSRALQDECATSLAPNAQHYLERIVAGTARMAQLIEDLLRLAGVAQHEMTHQSVDLTDLARTIVADLQKSDPQRRAEFAIAPGMVAAGDARLLRIALENLLGNAWKYTSKHAAARICFGQAIRGGRLVYLVRDDGAGFDMAYAGKLFGPFQRLHPESEFEGSGIGLATVQRIIHRHGGRIWAEGAVERGATVYFTLGEGGSNGAHPSDRR